ncbi:MAG TPA: hypothetical protein VHG29_02555 [Novosphingobium sp.]|nr:hypothetical protein [Novosphingobium sp.]
MRAPTRAAPFLAGPIPIVMPHPPLPADRAGEVALETACDLYHAALALVSRSGNPARDCHELLDPLGRMVALQHSRAGQGDCRALAEGLRCGDPEGALDACRRLIERETALLHGLQLPKAAMA